MIVDGESQKSSNNLVQKLENDKSSLMDKSKSRIISAKSEKSAKSIKNDISILNKSNYTNKSKLNESPLNKSIINKNNNSKNEDKTISPIMLEKEVELSSKSTKSLKKDEKITKIKI